MSTPAITTRPDREQARRQPVRRPDWSDLPEMGGSNTAGVGVALRPSVTVRESRGRIIRSGERAFDDRGRWWRARRRTSMVLRSPGMVLLGGLGCLVMIGLSPMLIESGAGDPLPVTGQIGPPVPGGEVVSAGAVPGAGQPGR